MRWILLILIFSIFPNSYSKPLELYSISLQTDGTAEKSTVGILNIISNQKNKKDVERMFFEFFSSIERQKKELLLELEKSAPKDSESAGTDVFQGLQKEYERLLEIYIACEALYIELNNTTKGPKLKNSCEEFRHEYQISINADNIDYSSYQTKVLEIHRRLCQ